VAKAYLAGLVVLALLITGYSGTYVKTGLTGDPPSIYNNYLGGLTLFASSEATSRRVSAIMSLDDVTRYSPVKHALLVIGPDKPLDASPSLVQWVEEGGLLVVMDESENSRRLLEWFNIYFSKEPVRVEIANATCTIGDVSIIVVFDVYTGLYSTESHEVVCRVGGLETGIARTVGKGRVVAIGDSSLVINEVLSKGPVGYANKLFVDTLTAGRDLLIYEGDRMYEYASTGVLVNYFRGTLMLATSIFQALFTGDTVWRLTMVSLLTSFTVLIVFMELGFPQHQASKKPRKQWGRR